MIYLKNFNFATVEDEDNFSFRETCYNTIYPFGILSKHDIEIINFDTITIFYGGNGSGKSTALNIISEKLKLVRDNLYNRSNFFEAYLGYCGYDADKIPSKSRIITSDDVFDFTMNLRYLNEGIDSYREDLTDEYWNLKESSFKLKSLDDYEELKRRTKANKLSKSQFIKEHSQNNVREHSNGESAFIYFTDKIESNALYLLDEPENSLSPEKQQELLRFIEDSVRFYNCQFIIATHSPFLLSLREAKIYDFDEKPACTKPWTELKNVRDYYNFFETHKNEFSKTKERQWIKETAIKPNKLITTGGNPYLNKDNYSDLGSELLDRLKEIWDNEDFIVGTMVVLNTEEMKQKMLDFLIKTGTKDSDEVIPYSLKIKKGLV